LKRGVHRVNRLNRGNHPYLLLIGIFGICTLFYYFGEIVNYFGWQTLHWELFYTIHDFHRLLFLIPIFYAGFVFGIRATAIVIIASFFVFLPRTTISNFPDAIPRIILDSAIIATAGLFFAMIYARYRNLYDAHTLVLSELNSAVKSLDSGKRLASNGVEIDITKRTIKRNGRQVKLTRKEFEVLSILVRNSGKPVSHMELLHSVWGPEYGQEIEYLRNFISQLRRKLENDPSNPQLIVTEQGVGYRFSGSE
jgi:DNA-binding winged helix-turn-helix (wHTH) protein